MSPDQTHGGGVMAVAYPVTRTVHLHIGAGKTGTSALQAAFVRNRDWLAGHGIDSDQGYVSSLSARAIDTT